MTANETLTIPARPARPFIGEALTLTSWDDVKPLYDNLMERPIQNADELRQWLIDRSELESYLSEDFAWRYIRMTCDTANEELVNNLNFFIAEIQPPMTAVGNELDLKAINSPYLSQLTDEGYEVMVRGMKKAIEIFREENIPIQTELQTEERKYGAIVGAMTVTIDGQEVTLPKAGDLLQSTDRTVREDAWRKIWERRYQDHEALDQLFDRLRTLRHQVAVNAGFANFRDYAFAALGRFDYTPQDCVNFHESVAEAVVPLLNELAKERKQKLGVDPLRPWDAKVDVEGRAPLKPFANGDELLEKAIACFDRLDKELGDDLRIMRAMGHLDLESRKGKAPGGYNYPLEEIGVPFIFMNATSSLRDLVTMVHEGGHAVHSFLTRDLPLKAFRNPPMEVAELASMSMELLSMDHWDVFFDNPEELRRAKLQHLESIIETLPWVATIDKFQHWVYEHPTHTDADRRENWLRIYEQFADSITNWDGFAYYKEYIWQRQLHLYEVPFYYIEYGIAQLGAIGVWRNYRRDPKLGLDGYKQALSLGYKRPIREIYEAAHVPFDFSQAHIQELMNFVWEEIKKLS
ncbi:MULTISPECIES: M3 family oligoendopeptidase [unclassified Spirosoma]|uniref:M3 family oligoendopeptidase n=1 Tax=unclassified Spirosoma TaxID=2621999 RepID=UPI0009666F80|nr:MULTISPECIES: M3 family oligoendopeptidase [unclassified Spirosoma]MBN8825923.1 M3 family oligoendopeptidase [Spirosoma sp.]OJW70607.1 MAG: oligoendopeptidase F [Spirosoma sp. 48-14]